MSVAVPTILGILYALKGIIDLKSFYPGSLE
jgi:hypothetical protein